MEEYRSLETPEVSKMYQYFLIAGILFASFNLRPGISSVGPLLGMIRDDFGLSNGTVGLLTTLPLVAFAFLSPIVPAIGAKLTNELAVTLGMIFLTFGLLIRSAPWVSLLFLGTLIVGAGIAILNVLIPGIIKDKFPKKVGVMTGMYTTAMGLTAGIASGVSVPIARQFDWVWALLIWATPAVIGVIIWIYLGKEQKKENAKRANDEEVDKEVKPIFSDNTRIWKSGLAWQMATFMALQSFVFYVTLSWLPEILHSNGFSESSAGWMLSFMQIIGLPASFLIPILADRLKDQRKIVIGIIIGMLFGFSTLLFGHSAIMMVIATAVIGLAVNGNFALALTFFGLRARNAKDASSLSGMAQSLGYLFSALGPVIIGAVYDLTGSWTTPLVIVLVTIVLLLFMGLLVGRDRYVLD